MSEGSPDYLAAFDAASPRLYPGEAEYELERGTWSITLSLPVIDDTVVPEAIDSSRSLLSRLGALDREAAAWLRAQPGWPYADDAVLWLLIVEPTNARFCYRQETANDEQVVGFRREADDWVLTGPDPRFRASSVSA
ncbi:hypothetical protein K9B35_13275 [Sphingomonas sp. R647]|uniref:hypothetical protein n=1 Tax=Sphingomonas sp. R647 TaxID=2875233 RepID=UPI001CD76EC7|nr:hypothetical protein [Sphingomonas sp. R647]MCA1198942.1 hypothetical protein [Sphingomonas sp. R647]